MLVLQCLNCLDNKRSFILCLLYHRNEGLRKHILNRMHHFIYPVIKLIEGFLLFPMILVFLKSFDPSLNLEYALL